MFAALLLALASQDAPALSSEGFRDRTGDGVAFLEVVADEEVLVVGQGFTLTLRIGVEEEFVDGGLIQLFRRPLGLPVQVQADWLGDLPGAEALVPPPADRTTSISLNGGIAEARSLDPAERDGRRYRMLELRRPHLATTAGEIEVPVSFLRFAYATRFREDFVNGRVPEDRIDAYVLSRPLTLIVRELPLVGQPHDFRGAVGSFTVNAQAEPRDLVLGGRLELQLTIEGEGNLEQLQPPPLDALRDLLVLGTVDRFEDGRRVVTYDLETRTTDTVAVPPIRLAFFDPANETYGTVETAAIPILVRPGLAAPTTPEPPAEPSGPNPLLLLLALPLAALAYVVVRRSRRSPGSSAQTLRLQNAARAFREHATETDVDPADALVEFVAALLECSPASVISRDLASRLRAAGLSGKQAEHTAELVERLHAPRYGGPQVENGLASARELVDELARG